MIAALLAASDPIIRYGDGEVFLTGWGLVWLFLFAMLVSK